MFDLVSFVFCSLFLSTLPNCFGVSIKEEFKIVAPDGASSDDFGETSSIYGNNIVIIGASGDDDDGSSSGSAYIFERDNINSTVWNLTKKLTASDATSNSDFGVSVSIADNVAIIGASAIGAYQAYIWENNSTGDIDDDNDGWYEAAILEASDCDFCINYYGASVSISNNGIAIVGAYRDDNDKGDEAGSAYIIERNSTGWFEIQKLLASDGADGDWYGRSVSISQNGQYAIVGAYIADKAYIYERDPSTGLFNETVALSYNQDASYGYAVSIIDEGIAMVGAYLNDINGIESPGSVFIYNRNNIDNEWYFDSKIIASDGGRREYFGESLSLTYEYAIIGARGANKAYLFKHDLNGSLFDIYNSSWYEIDNFAASDTDSNDRFGKSVSISDTTMIVGARLNHVGDVEDAGAAYIFSGIDNTPSMEPTQLPSNVPSSIPSGIPSMVPTGVPIDMTSDVTTQTPVNTVSSETTSVDTNSDSETTVVTSEPIVDIDTTTDSIDTFDVSDGEIDTMTTDMELSSTEMVDIPDPDGDDAFRMLPGQKWIVYNIFWNVLLLFVWFLQ